LLFQVAFQGFEQFATESHAELTHRIKVFTFIANVFNLATWRNAYGRNNAMNLRMKAQVLSLGMEYTHSTGLHPVMGITESTQGLSCASKKMLVKE